MSVDQVHGAELSGAIQVLMNRTVAELLALRGFAVDSFGAAGSSVVRFAA